MTSEGSGPPRSDLAKSMVTVAVMMATTVVILDMTIASIALPHMQGSLAQTRTRSAG